MEIDLKQLEKSRLWIEEYFLLQLIYEGIDLNLFNWFNLPDETCERLEEMGYLKILGSGDERILELRQKAVELFSKNTDSITDWIEQWCELWPKGVKGAGGYIKPNKNDALTNMVKFCKKYKFTKAQIFEATGNYIAEKQRDNWAYVMLGGYFIMKNGVSTLANYCSNIGLETAKRSNKIINE